MQCYKQKIRLIIILSTQVYSQIKYYRAFDMQLVQQIRNRKKSITFEKSNQKIIQKYVIKMQALRKGAVQRKKYKRMLVLKKRKLLIAKELMESERGFCEHVRFLIVNVMEADVFDDREMHDMMFKNLPKILELHETFLQKLTETMKNYHHHLTELSVTLKKYLLQEDFKKIYTTYCANYGKADQIAKIMEKSNSKFNALMKRLVEKQKSFNLQSFLIKPIQRLCRYKLIFGEYLKNMTPDHRDYKQMSDITVYAEKIVNQTNKDVEQFLFREKLIELQREYQPLFKEYCNPNRKILSQVDQLVLIDLQKGIQTQIKEMIIFNDGILIITEEPIFSIPIAIRQLPNLKYFKNLIQIIDSMCYYTIEFKKDQKRQAFLSISKQLPKDQNFISVRILGTENRESFFKNYTVYIVEIKDSKRSSTIYPRFKQLIKVQQFLNNKGFITRAPVLYRENFLKSQKSRTIERRKLMIQQFLQRIVNIPKTNKYMNEVYAMLQLQVTKNSSTLDSQSKVRNAQITVLLPNMVKVLVKVNLLYDKIKDLKKLVSASIGLQETGQFQIFQIREKVRKLMYEEESVNKIFEEQDSILTSFNPFKEQIQYMFTRHYYLTNEQEHTLFKEDFARTQLQLAVIRSQILSYRLEEELMITFMCLFALYANLPLGDDQKIASFIKDIGQKQYKVSVGEFRLYLTEVQNRMAIEQDQFITIPFVIIKIMSNSTLYRCQQFDVTVHQKQLRDIQTYIKGAQSKMILGVKRTGIMMMTVQNKHIIQSFSYQNVTIRQIHHTAIVFNIEGVLTPIRLLTTQSYQISILLEKYKGKPK